MNERPTPDPADDRLRSQLRALRPPDAAVDALGARVLAQWSERPGRSTGAEQNLLGAMGGTATISLRASRRRLWTGLTTGLIACAVVATVVVWVQRPDPALDELMQADVLSQMAIGEM